MIWLAWHMWFLLLLAFLLGLFVGWWIWHRSRIENVATMEPTPVVSPLPASVSAPLAEAHEAGKRPMLYESGPTEGPADDLKKIKGIGPKYEKLLNEMGIYYYRQITAWNKDEIAWLDKKLNFPGRIERDDWQAQAALLRDQSGSSSEF